MTTRPPQQCPFCGESFTPRMKTQIICGKRTCHRARMKEINRAYAARHPEKVRKARYAADSKRRENPAERQREAEKRQRIRQEVAELLAGISDSDLLAECRRRGWSVER